MQDVLAKLKDIAEKSDNRDINDAIKGAEMTQTVVAEKQEPTVDEVHEVIAEEEEAVNEIPTSNEISDLLRLSGQSGVLGISQPSVIIKEAKADPKIVARFAKVKPSQRSYYIMKWAEENGIDSDDAMEMAGYERGGYMGAGAFKWKYVGEGLRVVPKGKRHPTLGNNVVVGAGAKVLGPFEVGDNAKIGSNAVVTKQVPEGATVVGIPGRIIVASPDDEVRRKKMAEKIGFDAYGVSEEMPDPVARSIRSMLDHMHAVDERMEAMCKTLQSLDSNYKNSGMPPLNDDDFKGVRDEES